MTKQELLDKANDLPLAPGVYLMMDKSGEVIYVGQAKKTQKPRQSVFSRGFLPQRENAPHGRAGGSL